MCEICSIGTTMGRDETTTKWCKISSKGTALARDVTTTTWKIVQSENSSVVGSKTKVPVEVFSVRLDAL